MLSKKTTAHIHKPKELCTGVPQSRRPIDSGQRRSNAISPSFCSVSLFNVYQQQPASRRAVSKLQPEGTRVTTESEEKKTTRRFPIIKSKRCASCSELAKMHPVTIGRCRERDKKTPALINQCANEVRARAVEREGPQLIP